MQFTFIILSESAGLRLDKVVADQVLSISRSRAAALIADGCILLDNQQKTAACKVKAGAVVTGNVPETPVLPQPEPMDLDILYEDSWILVLNKPAGLVVHPASGLMSNTLVNGLLGYDAAFGRGFLDPVRPGIVHRLDKDTSGLILVAKTLKSLKFLQKEFKHRRVKKEYLALVHGVDIPDTGMIDLPIGRHPKHRKMMAVLPDGGKPARTGFRVRRRFDGFSLVQVRLYTGRTHQIRVHFYHMGMPLLGDPVYQVRRRRRKTCSGERQMLHSWTLGFRHPYSGRRMQFTAPVPGDMNLIMDHSI